MRILLTALCGFVLSVQVFAQGPSKEGPSALSPLFYQAETYRITGRTNLAGEAYLKLLAEDPTHEAALYQLGRMLLQGGDYLGALSVLKTGHEAHPENEWMHQLYGLCEAKLGHFPEAIAAFQSLALQRPDKPEYLEAALDAAVSGELFLEADQVVQRFEATYGQTPESAEQRVRFLVQSGDEKGAVKVLKTAISTNADSPEYVGLLAQLYDSQKLGKKALKVLDKGLDRHPNNGPLHLEKARILQQLGRWDEATEALINAFETDGVSLSTKGQILMDFHKVAREELSFVEPFDRLWRLAEEKHIQEPGWQLVQAERSRYDALGADAVESYANAIKGGLDAIEVYDAAVQTAKEYGLKAQGLELLEGMYDTYGKDPKVAKYAVSFWAEWYAWEKCAPAAAEVAEVELDPEVKQWLHSTAGYAFYQSKDIDQAVVQYEKSLQLKRDAQTLNNYAWALAKNDRELEKAEQLSAESNAKEQGQPLYLDTWALVLYKLGKYAQAQEKMEVALQLAKSAPTQNMLTLAAKIEEALGNQDKALIFRAKAKELRENK